MTPPILSAAELWERLQRLGVHLSLDRVWWHTAEERILRVRDPMFCLTRELHQAIAFWADDLKARVAEWIGDDSPVPAAWRKGWWCGVVDVPISGEAEDVKQIRVLNRNTGQLE